MPARSPDRTRESVPVVHGAALALVALVAVILLGAACARAPLAGSPESPALGTADAASWPVYNRTRAVDRFSPLGEINGSNVAQMKTVCTYTLPEVTSLQTGPLVVDGTMYFTTDTVSYAIDAGTCAERWKQARHSDTPSHVFGIR